MEMNDQAVSAAKKNPAIMQTATMLNFQTGASFEYALEFCARSYVAAAYCDEMVTVKKTPDASPSDRDKFRQRFQSLLDENAELCAANERLAALCQTHEQEIGFLRAKLFRLKQHIKDAATQARRRRAEIKGHQRKIVKLQESIDRLNANCAALADDQTRSEPCDASIRDALEWYGEQARLARLIHSEGTKGRQALASDGGERAKIALAKDQPAPDHDAIEIGNIENFHGGLCLKRENGEDFWCIENHNGLWWEPCNSIIADALRNYETRKPLR